MQSQQFSQDTYSIASPSPNSINSTNTTHQRAEGISILFFGILLCSLAGIAAYKRYRTVNHKKQIQMLERVWQLNIHEQSY